MFEMLPEILVIVTAFAVLILDLIFLDGKKDWLAGVALAGVGLSLLSTGSFLGVTSELLSGRFAIDPLSTWFKLIFLLATGLTIALSQGSFAAHAKVSLKSRGEFLTVLLFSLAGMMFLVSSRDLISLYVSLELATIPLIALTAWPRTERAGEGALKYLVTAALASAFLLYGFGLLYGLAGTTTLALINEALEVTPALWLSMALIAAGVGFKLTLFPFHMWAPDAYEGAPTPITAFLSVASKAAGLGVGFQLFYRVFGYNIESWQVFIAVVATLTMTLGNIVAVLQNNLKRFMAYSAIAQAGCLILGFLGHGAAQAGAMVFFMLIYVLTNLAAFAVFNLHIHQTGEEDIKSLRGLSRRNPLLALAAMIALFGLAGIPPLAGFLGKFFLFSVAAKVGLYWLVAVAALNSTVSLYYYLRIVRQMYIEPADEGSVPLKIGALSASGLFVATVGSVACGVVPFFYERIGLDAGEWLRAIGLLSQ